jgi:endo-1,4-beta-xylanase
VNLYGTYFRISGDFEIKATVKDLKGGASLRFYDSPPIIQDEFRVEPKSIGIAIRGTTATATKWNGYSNEQLSAQKPSSSIDHALSSDATYTIITTRHQGRIAITVNDVAIADFPEDGLFDTGTLWVGADASETGGSWTLSSLRTQGHVATVNTQDDSPMAKQSTGLQQLASSRRPGFLIGTAVALGPLVADSKYAQLVLGGNFGQITTENALKWQFVQPQRSVYDFHEADALMAIAHKNGLKVHGHTLVFGEANPPWVRDLPLTTAANKLDVRHVMTDHISTTMRHYKGKITSWDVVNEPIAEDDVSLRQHIWYKAMGEEYIKIAFAAAREADPQAQLFINEYGLEQNGDRWDTFLALVTRLKSQGVPIDGVGLQAHIYDIQEDAIDPAVLRSHIQALAKLGLLVRISEMDVDSSGGANVQAKQYNDVLRACLAEPSCISWSTWGVSDAYNVWQDEGRKLQHGQDLLWGSDYQPTPAIGALTSVLNNR